MKISRAGDMGGGNFKITIEIPASAAQIKILDPDGSKGVKTIELDITPTTARAEELAATLHPMPIPKEKPRDPKLKGRGSRLPDFDMDDPEFKVAFIAMRRKQAVVKACFALGKDYFGVEDFEEQKKIITGPATHGGLTPDQIQMVADKADEPMRLTVAEQESIAREVPFDSTEAQQEETAG